MNGTQSGLRLRIRESSLDQYRERRLKPHSLPLAAPVRTRI